MADYAPNLLCCSAFFYMGEVAEWRHSATCHAAPQLPVSIPHGMCGLHPTESLFDCRGCEATYDATHEVVRDAEERAI